MAVTLNPAEPVVFQRLTNDNSCRLGLGGRKITLRHRPTVDWLAALADQKLHTIMPGMLRDKDVRWYMSLLADPTCAFDLRDSHAITHAVIREVTGVPWWTAVRLANAAGRSWFLADPATLMRGVDMLALPIRRTLSVVYVLAVETCENDRERAVLDADLFRPPEGTEPAWTAVQQAASFAAFRQANAMFARPSPAVGSRPA